MVLCKPCVTINNAQVPLGSKSPLLWGLLTHSSSLYLFYYSLSLYLQKSCGDGKVATRTGMTNWKYVVTNLHGGDHWSGIKSFSYLGGRDRIRFRSGD